VQRVSGKITVISIAVTLARRGLAAKLRTMAHTAVALMLALITAGMLHADGTVPTSAIAAVAPAPAPAGRQQVVVIPVREQIATPVLYILRRGLKEAIERKADIVVLDIKTPGGALDVTFEIMEALAKFPGKTVAFVNNEAMSAGAFISAMADEIYFTPDGIIGAAAPVSMTGQDVDKTMKAKIVSYLKARIRAISEGHGYRGQVISAMIDENYELKIADQVLKEKGELLSLTATEASKTYGDPPRPLLAAGIAKDVDALLNQKFGVQGWTAQKLEVTWSEHLAVWLNAIAPILLGLGLLALFIEFKTPGFGIFGISGIVLLGIVFMSSYVAGFSGHEPVLLFALGFILVLVELIFFPGVVLIALPGLLMMLGSLVWSMADIWPNEPITFSGDLYFEPLIKVGSGVFLAVVCMGLLLRFMPRGWVWDRMILGSAIAEAAQNAGGSASGSTTGSLIGRRAVAATVLRPAGQIEIDGRRYEARLDVGSADPGAPVVVTGQNDFGLVVEKIKS
jgi:membrane-bound serine protease (ClpP class)